MSGKITESQDLINANNGGKERISGLLWQPVKKRDKSLNGSRGYGLYSKTESARSNHTTQW
jgi:hypothetical protein